MKWRLVIGLRSTVNHPFPAASCSLSRGRLGEPAKTFAQDGDGPMLRPGVWECTLVLPLSPSFSCAQSAGGKPARLSGVVPCLQASRLQAIAGIDQIRSREAKLAHVDLKGRVVPQRDCHGFLKSNVQLRGRAYATIPVGPAGEGRLASAPAPSTARPAAADAVTRRYCRPPSSNMEGDPLVVPPN